MNQIAVHIDGRLADRLKREGFTFSELSHAVDKKHYDFAFENWKHLGEEAAHVEAAMYCLTHPSHGPLYVAKTEPDQPQPTHMHHHYSPRELRPLLWILLALLMFLCERVMELSR